MKKLFVIVAAVLCVAGCNFNKKKGEIPDELLWKIFMAVPAEYMPERLSSAEQREAVKVVPEPEIAEDGEYFEEECDGEGPAPGKNFLSRSTDYDEWEAASIVAYPFSDGKRVFVIQYNDYVGIDIYPDLDMDINYFIYHIDTDAMVPTTAPSFLDGVEHWYAKEDGLELRADFEFFLGHALWNGETFILSPEYTMDAYCLIPESDFPEELPDKDIARETRREAFFAQPVYEEEEQRYSYNEEYFLTYSGFNGKSTFFCDFTLYKYSGKDQFLCIFRAGDQSGDGEKQTISLKAYDYNPADRSLKETKIPCDGVSRKDFDNPFLTWPDALLSDGTYLLDNEYRTECYPGPDMLRYYPVCEDISWEYSSDVVFDWNGSRFVKAAGPDDKIINGSMGFAGYIIGIGREAPKAGQIPGYDVKTVVDKDDFTGVGKHVEISKDGNLIIKIGVLDFDGSIYDLELFSPAYKTSGGFGVGSLMKDVIEYPKDVFADYPATAEWIDDGGTPCIRLTPFWSSDEMLFYSDDPNPKSPKAKITRIIFQPIAVG